MRMPVLTSKGRWKFCQAKSGCFRQFLRRKKHICGPAAAATAIGCIQIPIRSVYVLARCISERAGHSIDGSRRAFEFEEGADRCFIEVQMQAGKAECGPVFLVAEARAQADGAQGRWPAGWPFDREFPFEALLVARTAAGRGNGSLRGEDRTSGPARQKLRGRRRLDAQPQQAPPPAEISGGSVVQRILFEDAPVQLGAQPLQAADQRRQVGDAKLYFDFASCAKTRGHDRDAIEYSAAPTMCRLLDRPSRSIKLVAKAGMCQHNRIPAGR